MPSPSPHSQIWRWEVERVLKGLDSGLTTNGVQFPATQVPSADPNTLDDYAEGTWTPTVTAGSGTITTASATGRYTKIGRAVFFQATLTITTNGTGAVSLAFTLPPGLTPAASNAAALCGRENAVNGKSLNGIIGAGAATGSVMNYDNTYPGVNGASLVIAGHYIAAN